MMRDEPSTGGREDPIVTDAELVGYLDGELTAAAKAALEARILASPGASARLDTLRHRSARVSVLLSHANPPQAQVQRSAERIRPHMVRAHPWAVMPALLKAAAGIVLLFGVAFAVPPSRAWLLERIRDVAAQLGSTPRTQAPETPVPQPPVAAPFELGFTVATDTFDVHVPQAAGVLVIRRGSGDRVRAEANAGVSFVALPPRGVRIEGSVSADARYILTLPPRVQAVRVFVGERAAEGRVHAMTGDGELLIALGSAR